MNGYQRHTAFEPPSLPMQHTITQTWHLRCNTSTEECGAMSPISFDLNQLRNTSQALFLTAVTPVMHDFWNQKSGSEMQVLDVAAVSLPRSIFALIRND